jgi:hypothetical protein
MVRLKKRNPVSQTGKPGNPGKETKKSNSLLLNISGRKSKHSNVFKM